MLEIDIDNPQRPIVVYLVLRSWTHRGWDRASPVLMLAALVLRGVHHGVRNEQRIIGSIGQPGIHGPITGIKNVLAKVQRSQVDLEGFWQPFLILLLI